MNCCVEMSDRTVMKMKTTMQQATNIRLGDICTFMNGGTPSKSVPRYFAGNIPWITGADILDSVVKSARSFITEEGIANSATNRVPAGTVLLVTRTSVGKVAIAGIELCYSQDITALKPDLSKVTVDYLVQFLRTQEAYFKRRSRGATIKGVTKAVLENLEIPLPPIAEQKRIAAILDKAEELRGLRRMALGELDAIVQSIFLEMFGDPVTNLKGWKSKNLDECAERIQIGPFGTQLHQEDYIDNGIPAINPTHIKSGKILPDASFSVSIEKYQQLSQYHLKIDDVILGRRGEMGRCAMVSEIENGWLCGTGSLFVRPKHESLNPVYLSFLLSSRSIRKYLERASQGVTMANLNKTIVGQIPVSLVVSQILFSDKRSISFAFR